MAKIKQFDIFNYSKVSKMLLSISPDEKISFFPLLRDIPIDLVQNFLPLQFKKSPEAYIAIKNKEVKAYINIEKVIGNKKKWYIKKLFLAENSFDEGSQLIDYIVSKYGALGADTFCVLIDENDNTLARLFSKMCGFRLCSREVIWKVKDYTPDNLYAADRFKVFKNSYSKETADFYNDCIEPHFRFSIAKRHQEFKTFWGNNSLKYILKSENGEIITYIEVKKINENDILLDIITSKAYEDNYPQILGGILKIVEPKYNAGNIFVINRKYMNTANSVDDFMKNRGFEKTQTKMLLVKDFYKPIKHSENIVNPAVIFNEISGTPAFMTPTNTLQKSD